MSDRWFFIPLREYDGPNGTATDPAYVHEHDLWGHLAFRDTNRYLVRAYGETAALDLLAARDGVSEPTRNELVSFVKDYVEGGDYDSAEEVRDLFSLSVSDAVRSGF